MAKKTRNTQTQAPKAKAPSAAPGAKAPEAAKGKTERIAYPVPDGGLSEFPKDFDGKKHKTLKRGDFADETVWLEMKATECDKRAAAYRAEATEMKKLGTVKERAKAKRLLAMHKRMAELQEQLKKDGVDVYALLSATSDE